MRFFDWHVDREAYGGSVYQWKAKFEQMDAFPEIVVVQPTSPEERNFPHVSEYLQLGERDSGLPWNEAVLPPAVRKSDG